MPGPSPTAVEYDHGRSQYGATNYGPFSAAPGVNNQPLRSQARGITPQHSVSHNMAPAGRGFGMVGPGMRTPHHSTSAPRQPDMSSHINAYGSQYF